MKNVTLIICSVFCCFISYAQQPQLWVEGQTSQDTFFFDSFEDDQLTPFITGGEGTWQRQDSTAFDGTWSMELTGVGAEGEGYIEAQVNVPNQGAVLSFAYAIEIMDSEPVFNLIINGMQMTSIFSGRDWTKVKFNLKPGVNTIRWIFRLDGNSNIARLDAAMLTRITDHAIRLQDGQEGFGKVLVSDASGNATWKDAASALNQGDLELPLVLIDSVPGVLAIRETYDGAIAILENKAFAGTGLRVLNSFKGIQVLDSYEGISVDYSEHTGIDIRSPGQIGLDVRNTGSYGIRVKSSNQSGILIDDSGYNGIYINESNNDGISIISSGDDGISVSGSEDDGVFVSNSGDNGIFVTDSDNDGIRIDDSGNMGIRIINTVGDGININNSGHFGILINQSQNEGLRIAEPDGIGIRIQQPNSTGVVIEEAAANGISIYNASNKAAYFSTTSASTDHAVFIDQQNDRYDLYLNGHGKVATQGSYFFQLDEDNNAIADRFYIKNSAGSNVAVFSETGNAAFLGNISKAGGSFKIDHPLDPENKYLYHSFVESPDMMNVYNGNVMLDNSGEATVTLPDYFEALNRDFRYQLTAVGAPGPNLYVRQKVIENTFVIAGGTPNTEVSWQVTGIRQDPFANENRIPNTVEKEEGNKGRYLHPKAWAKVKHIEELPAILTEVGNSESLETAQKPKQISKD